MYFLKEAVGTITYPMDRSAAYGTLLSRLKKLRLPVEKADESKGEVVVPGYTGGRAADTVTSHNAVYGPGRELAQFCGLVRICPAELRGL
jgi:hypothetical protein